ncbi:marine proteobacterial sortase target protein [Novosphingobium sp. YAF33]|uniref:marine proteobacterial sortase target protein n=1 Tax=Novosphingobium sp. YAF33 TaxID=3233082 RepID=UPI003F9A9ABC
MPQSPAPRPLGLSHSGPGILAIRRTLAIRRALVPAIVLALGAPLAVAVHSTAAVADETAVDDAAPDDGPAAGTLMLRGQGAAKSLPAVRLGTDMDVTVTGQVASVRVTQAFRNTSDKWMEASYLYPLPQDGAVDSLKMVVGQRVIVGHIEPRAKARETYEAAKASGRKAGLVEQQRPNMFSTMVANVAPGETVLIAIEYQAPVSQANGTFSLRLPLVVGPRYTPPHTLGSAAAVEDAHAVTAPPVLDPALGARLGGGRGDGLNPTSISVHLAPGFEVANLISRYHRINVAGATDNRTVTLADATVPANRDFVLDWRSASADPALGLFAQHTDKGDYVMAAITPPANLDGLPRPPREMVFVIDNSGSMGGDSMEEAKASLIHALGTLRPQDHFNVIRFDDTMTRLFEHSVSATSDQVALATRFAESLQAQGGTEMLPALKAALDDAGTGGGTSPEVLRQIVFLTDGEISNEREMMAAIGDDGGRSHVFMVGIGSAPNDFLMERMSTIGGGVYTHVGAPGEVAAKMMPLLDVLSHPAVRDLSVRVEGGSLDLTPSRLPDVYAGRPLVLVGRSDKLSGTLTVSGNIGGKPWVQRVDLSAALPSPAIEKLWAHRRITDVEADRALGKLEDDRADAEIERIGMEHAIVTRQTSLVAVDETPARPAGARLTREELPINLPAGWDFEALFGQDAVQAAPGQEGTGDLAAMQAQALELPQTATGFLGLIGKGLALLLAGMTGFALLLRRRAA